MKKLVTIVVLLTFLSGNLSAKTQLIYPLKWDENLLNLNQTDYLERIETARKCDQLILKNGDTIKANINTIAFNHINYFLCDSSNPSYNILKKEVRAIYYADYQITFYNNESYGKGSNNYFWFIPDGSTNIIPETLKSHYNESSNIEFYIFTFNLIRIDTSYFINGILTWESGNKFSIPKDAIMMIELESGERLLMNLFYSGNVLKNTDNFNIFSYSLIIDTWLHERNVHVVYSINKKQIGAILASTITSIKIYFKSNNKLLGTKSDEYGNYFNVFSSSSKTYGDIKRKLESGIKQFSENCKYILEL